MLKLILSIVLLICFSQCFGQLSSYCKKYSSDNSHYFITKPYSDQIYDTLGNTSVYDAAGKKIWEINRYFSGGNTFISNSGQVLVHVMDYESDWSPQFETPAILFFEKGELVKSYEVDVLNILTWWRNFSFRKLQNNDKVLTDNVIREQKKHPYIKETGGSIYLINMFTNGDTLNVINQKEQIISFDLSSRQMIGKIKNGVKYLKKQGFKYDDPRTECRELEFEMQFGIPELSDGKSFEEAISAYLGYKHIPSEEIASRDLKNSLVFEVQLLIDYSGKGEIFTIETQEREVLEKVKSFLEGVTFTNKYHDREIEKRLFKSILFMSREN